MSSPDRNTLLPSDAMRIIKDIAQMQEFADQARCRGEVIGLVPTMGYFHEGHLSLMKIARQRADQVVVSLFVNPTQFGKDEDLDKYPIDLKRDHELAEQIGVDVMFEPMVEQMYPEGYQTSVRVEEISQQLCGAYRPDHFGGVATVCTKLFCAVKPHFAVFGQKDHQQLQVVTRLVRDLNLDLKIVPGPLVREDDGLALSSRNVYMKPEQRQAAPLIHSTLVAARHLFEAGERDAQALEEFFKNELALAPRLKTQYATVSDAYKCTPIIGQIKKEAVFAVAVVAGESRLIDNLILEENHNQPSAEVDQ